MTNSWEGHKGSAIYRHKPEAIKSGEKEQRKFLGWSDLAFSPGDTRENARNGENHLRVAIVDILAERDHIDSKTGIATEPNDSLVALDNVLFARDTDWGIFRNAKIPIREAEALIKKLMKATTEKEKEDVSEAMVSRALEIISEERMAA